MNRRHFIMAAGVAGALLITGCSGNEEKIIGYWKMDVPGQTVTTMAIQPDAQSYYVRIRYRGENMANKIFNSDAIIEGAKITLRRDNRQFVYRSSDDTLQDTNNKTVIFKRTNMDDFP